MPGSFNPDWASPPGDTILDLMEEHDVGAYELACYLGMDTKQFAHLIDGTEALKIENACVLSGLFGGSIEFWLERERQYRERLLLLNT